MKLVEKIDVTPTIESKYIRADLLWNQIAKSAFFSKKEKAKIWFVLKNEPEAHAHWIKGTLLDATCSNCGFWLRVSDSTIPKMAYCPHCGAKMDEEEK